jgi:hypothetical protein
MAAGAPAGSLSKKTLWPTLPKAKVTVPPTLSAIVGGVKASVGVASTCAAETGGGAFPAPVVDGVSGFVDELQPATADEIMSGAMMRRSTVSFLQDV